MADDHADELAFVSPQRPPRRKVATTLALPGHALAAAKGSRGRLNDDMWTMLGSKRADTELDGAVLVDRQFRPFADPDVFPPGRDLGPFETYRSMVVRERVGATTRPSFVEPRAGWIISSPCHLVERGLINMHNLSPPSFSGFVRGRRRASRTQVPAVINLRDRGEQHYGHVVQDLFGGRLRMASEHGLDETPILVSARLFERSFFQDLVRRAGLKDRNFILHRDQLVSCAKVFYFDTTHYSAASVRGLQTMLAVPDADPDDMRRIFIVRKQEQFSGRGLLNLPEISDVCRRFGFEMVATDDMGIDEQVELFSQAGIVAGVHGSALVNVAFRKNAKLTLLEIFPPGTDPMRLRPWCFFEAAALGHDYQHLSGLPSSSGITGKAAYRQDFSIDPARLAQKMASVVDSA